MAEIIVENNVVNGLQLVNEGDKLHVQYNGHAKEAEVYSGAEIHISAGGTATSTYVYSSGFMYVSEGGIATSTHLRPSAWMEVFSGGTANAAVVGSKSTLIVYNGGYATIAYNPWGGNVISSAGAHVDYLHRNAGIYYGGNNDGLISAGDTMDGLVIGRNLSAVVYGENYAYVNGGTSKTANAGILNSATVQSRAYLHISNGGLASSTTVSAGGSMYVSSGGSADIADIRGDIVISRGGSINSVTVTGSMNLQNGGSAANTTVLAGATVNGISITRSETFTSGLSIHDGMVGGQAFVSNGVLVDDQDAYLYDNQSAIDTTIYATGTLNISSGGDLISGFVYDDYISDKPYTATVIVFDGGLADSTVVQGARAGAGTGPLWPTSRILDLYETFIYSNHITSTWNTKEAYLIVESGGSATNTQVQYNGSMVVLSSGYAEGVNVEGASWAYYNWNQSHTVSTLFSSGSDSAFLHANGGTVYGADINRLGYMYVYNNGFAESTFINWGGQISANDNGTVYRTSVFSGGNLYIESNGLGKENTIYEMGMMYVAHGGRDIGTVISSGGYADVAAGGQMSRTMIMSSGTLTLMTGARGGGSDDSASEKLWWNNGIIINSAGVLKVESGASAYVIYNPWSGTVISNSGAEVHYQKFDEVTGVYYGGQAPGLVSLEDSMTRLNITSGYSAMVFQGGELTEGTLSEKTAYLHVYRGGKVNNTVAVTSSVVNGFTLQENNYYDSGIKISNAYVGSRTSAALYDGQTATDVTVNLHGSLYIEGGAKITSSFFHSGAVINGFTISESNENANTINISSAIAISGASAFIFNGQTVQESIAQAGVIINGITLQEENYYKDGLTISKGIVEDGNKAYIYSGQTASGNTIEKGGLFTVNNGGAAYETILKGSMNISMAAYVSGVNVSSGGVMTVANGASVADIKVNRGARVTISSGAAINGFLLLRANTYTNNIIISSAIVNAGITTELYDGINAKGITIDTNGRMFVSNNGWASNTKVLSAGELHLSSGGKAIDTTISSGGIVHVFSGATASDTELLSGGYLGIGNGGNIYQTTISSGGALTIWLGGSAVSNTIMPQGNVFVSYGAIAKENSIASGGGLHIYSGGLASATSIAQSAFLGVGNGGIAYGNTVESCGEVIVWGGGLVDTNTIDTWGAIILSSGAAANSTTVGSNAGLHIYSGATAYSTEVTSGAQLGVGLGGILYNAACAENSKIDLYDGAVLRGWNEFSGTVTILGEVDASGSFVVFDLNGRKDTANPIINNAAAVKEAQFFLASGNQIADGQYILAGGAGDFLGMTISLAGTDQFLDIGGATVNHNGKNYTAGVTNGNLWVDIRTSYTSYSLDSWQEESASSSPEAASLLTDSFIPEMETAACSPGLTDESIVADDKVSFLAVI